MDFFKQKKDNDVNRDNYDLLCIIQENEIEVSKTNEIKIKGFFKATLMSFILNFAKNNNVKIALEISTIKPMKEKENMKCLAVYVDKKDSLRLDEILSKKNISRDEIIDLNTMN